MSENLIAEISKSKLESNVKSVKKLLSSNVKLCLVVKADGYGHGICEVASILYKYCDMFAVSLLEEAELLRISGIDKDILLLTPVTENTVKRLILSDITLPVTTFNELYLIENACKDLNYKAKVHIAINSGMNRLGFSTLSSVNKVVNFIKNSEFVILDGAFSHFGNPENKDYTLKSYLEFLRLSEPVKHYNENSILHISASGGILSSDKYHLDMVRPGILIYGYKPFNTNLINVLPAMKLKARTLLTRDNLLNNHALYGDKLSLHNEGTLIRLGYADGFLRGNVQGFINDLCMDLSYLNGKSKGKYALVMDDAEVLAKKWNTITYEVLVSVTKRAKRVYLE